MSDQNRYLRQEILPEIGKAGQEKLSNANIVVVGAGGLGAPLLSYLAGAGIGNITIIDHDLVELSNLHRQPLFNEDDIGLFKASTAKEHLSKYNSKISIKNHNCRLEPSNVESLCKDADVIIDAADSFAVTYILSDYALKTKTPYVSASVLGFKGYVGAFCGTHAPSIRAVFPDLPISAQNCATAGVSGPAVGVLGTLQAQITLNILLELSPSPMGKMLNVDLINFTTSSFSFLGASEPKNGFKFISQSQINEDDVVIDVRSKEESPNLITPDTIRSEVATIATIANDANTLTNKPVIIVCKTGLRAWNAGLNLQNAGIKDIKLIAAG
ncbi:MAG: ThiF family adenylyltransferase [Nitratireductor sp.]